MQYIDNPNSGRHAIMSPELAVMSGAIRTDSLDDLRRFERAFPFDPLTVIEVSKEVLSEQGVASSVEPDAAQTLLSPKEKTDIVFKTLLPRLYRASAAPGWTANIYFDIEGASDYTVNVSTDGVSVSEGRSGVADATVTTDAATFSAVMRFGALEDANQIDDINIVDDEIKSEELSDESLELVAGGKGSSVCGAESCGADACNGAATGAGACGAAFCTAAATGAGACGAAAGIMTVCAADACGAAACRAAAGGATVCGGDACSAAATGAGVCGAAACAGAACGADACGAAACAGAACGAAVGAKACGVQACGADAAPGIDFGPCAVNVIPIIPFI